MTWPNSAGHLELLFKFKMTGWVFGEMPLKPENPMKATWLVGKNLFQLFLRFNRRANFPGAGLPDQFTQTKSEKLPNG